jgi:hypothetical protein
MDRWIYRRRRLLVREHQPLFRRAARLASPAGDRRHARGAESIRAADDSRVLRVRRDLSQHSQGRPQRGRLSLVRSPASRPRGEDRPLLRRVPLRTAKAQELETFERVLGLMRERRHLELDGIAEIAILVEGMNQRRPSAFLSFLRDCTPAASADEAKRQSVLRGDAKRSAEMTGPLDLPVQSKPGRATGSLASNS